MATLAIGDIHGNVAALTKLLERIRTESGSGDTVVFLGDYIDRGPDSRGCVEAILQFRADSPADVVCLLGNHEEWFLETEADYSRHSWLLGMDGHETIASYSRDADLALRRARSGAGLRLYTYRCELPYEVFFDAMPASHRAFFSELELSHQTAECLCSHAGVDPTIPRLADQSPRVLVWGHPSFPEEYAGEVPVVYGHWNNGEATGDSGARPAVIANTIGVDTSAHGVVSAVRMPDRRIFQSNGRETTSFTV